MQYALAGVANVFELIRGRKFKNTAVRLSQPHLYAARGPRPGRSAAAVQALGDLLHAGGKASARLGKYLT